MQQRYSQISGWGKYAPDKIVTNFDLEKTLDTSNEWIVQRTGIEERRVAADNETTATMAVAAARKALDVAGLTPLLKMYTLGHGFIPPPVHAGGLRYHGMAPLICHLHKLGFVEARAEHQLGTFEAGIQFARTEGIISAPETTHAIRATIDEAIKCRETGEAKTILLAHSGHGHVDMAAYDAYLSGKLQNYEYPKEMVDRALADLPKVNQ